MTVHEPTSRSNITALSPALNRAVVVGWFSLALLFTGCQSGPGRYPDRELKLIVQAAPGGISDTVSRVMASLVERELGVPVVCENKPGAAGALAFSYVTRQSPSGYVLGHAPVEIAMVRALGYADVGPDNMDLICLVSKTQPVLAVRTQAPWGTFQDFLAAARGRPGYLIVANSGTGSIWHFNTLLMEQNCNVRVTHVPFGGSSASLANLLGGHVDAAVAGAGELVSNVKAGQLRVLAVLDERRSRLFPEVPSVHELGYAFGASAWSGFFTPQGTSLERLAFLETTFRKAFQSPQFRTLCDERGMEPYFLSRGEFRDFAAQQSEFFSREIPHLLRLER